MHRARFGAEDTPGRKVRDVYDDEAVYFECRGKDSGIVRFSHEVLETLKQVVEEE